MGRRRKKPDSDSDSDWKPSHKKSIVKKMKRLADTKINSTSMNVLEPTSSSSESEMLDIPVRRSRKSRKEKKKSGSYFENSSVLSSASNDSNLKQYKGTNPTNQKDNQLIKNENGLVSGSLHLDNSTSKSIDLGGETIQCDMETEFSSFTPSQVGLDLLSINSGPDVDFMTDYSDSDDETNIPDPSDENENDDAVSIPPSDIKLVIEQKNGHLLVKPAYGSLSEGILHWYRIYGYEWFDDKKLKSGSVSISYTKKIEIGESMRGFVPVQSDIQNKIFNGCSIRDLLRLGWSYKLFEMNIYVQNRRIAGWIKFALRNLLDAMCVFMPPECLDLIRPFNKQFISHLNTIAELTHLMPEAKNRFDDPPIGPLLRRKLVRTIALEMEGHTEIQLLQKSDVPLTCVNKASMKMKMERYKDGLLFHSSTNYENYILNKVYRVYAMEWFDTTKKPTYDLSIAYTTKSLQFALATIKYNNTEENFDYGELFRGCSIRELFNLGWYCVPFDLKIYTPSSKIANWLKFAFRDCFNALGTFMPSECVLLIQPFVHELLQHFSKFPQLSNIIDTIKQRIMQPYSPLIRRKIFMEIATKYIKELRAKGSFHTEVLKCMRVDNIGKESVRNTRVKKADKSSTISDKSLSVEDDFELIEKSLTNEKELDLLSPDIKDVIQWIEKNFELAKGAVVYRNRAFDECQRALNKRMVINNVAFGKVFVFTMFSSGDVTPICRNLYTLNCENKREDDCAYVHIKLSNGGVYELPFPMDRVILDAEKGCLLTYKFVTESSVSSYSENEKCLSNKNLSAFAHQQMLECIKDWIPNNIKISVSSILQIESTISYFLKSYPLIPKQLAKDAFCNALDCIYPDSKKIFFSSPYDNTINMKVECYTGLTLLDHTKSTVSRKNEEMFQYIAFIEFIIRNYAYQDGSVLSLINIKNDFEETQNITWMPDHIKLVQCIHTNLPYAILEISEDAPANIPAFDPRRSIFRNIQKLSQPLVGGTVPWLFVSSTVKLTKMYTNHYFHLIKTVSSDRPILNYKQDGLYDKVIEYAQTNTDFDNEVVENPDYDTIQTVPDIRMFPLTMLDEKLRNTPFALVCDKETRSKFCTILSSICLTYGDFVTLLPDQECSDSIINAALEVLCKETKNTAYSAHYISLSICEQLVSNNSEEMFMDIASQISNYYSENKYLIFPMYMIMDKDREHGHYVIIISNRRGRYLTVYDPFKYSGKVTAEGMPNNKFMRSALLVLNKLLQLISNEVWYGDKEDAMSELEYYENINIPMQEGSNTCGVFILLAAEVIITPTSALCTETKRVCSNSSPNDIRLMYFKRLLENSDAIEHTDNRCENAVECEQIGEEISVCSSEKTDCYREQFIENFEEPLNDDSNSITMDQDKELNLPPPSTSSSYFSDSSNIKQSSQKKPVTSDSKIKRIIRKKANLETLKWIQENFVSKIHASISKQDAHDFYVSNYKSKPVNDCQFGMLLRVVFPDMRYVCKAHWDLSKRKYINIRKKHELQPTFNNEILKRAENDKGTKKDLNINDSHKVNLLSKDNNETTIIQSKENVSASRSGYKHTKMKCPICRVETRNKTDMARHMDYFHEICKPFKCQQCDADFHTPRGVQIHELKFHGQRDTFPCTICGKGLKGTVGTKKSHMDHVHKNKPYGCFICIKSFETQDLQERHFRVNKCREIFNQNFNLF